MLLFGILFVYLTLDDHICLSMVIPFHSNINVRELSSWNLQDNIEEQQILPYQTNVLKQGQVPSEHSHLSIEANENNLVRDQESNDFRHCLELCEIIQNNELKPNHDCIRRKCLEEITGI